MFVFALFVQSKLEKVFWLFIENESELNSKKIKSKNSNLIQYKFLAFLIQLYYHFMYQTKLNWAGKKMESWKTDTREIVFTAIIDT